MSFEHVVITYADCLSRSRYLAMSILENKLLLCVEEDDKLSLTALLVDHPRLQFWMLDSRGRPLRHTLMEVPRGGSLYFILPFGPSLLRG